MLAVYLGRSLEQAVGESSLRNRAEEALADAVAHVPGARIAEVRLRGGRGRTDAFVVIRTPSPLTQQDVVALDEALDRDDLDLHLRVVRVAEWTRSGPIHGIRWRTSAEPRHGRFRPAGKPDRPARIGRPRRVAGRPPLPRTEPAQAMTRRHHPAPARPAPCGAPRGAAKA